MMARNSSARLSGQQQLLDKTDLLLTGQEKLIAGQEQTNLKLDRSADLLEHSLNGTAPRRNQDA